MFRHSEFHAEKGGIAEHFFAGVPAPGDDFTGEARALLAEYRSVAERHACSQESEILLRFHLSDVTNQAPFLRELIKDRSSFVSIAGQPPACGSRIALEAWHWCGGKCKQLKEGSLDCVTRNYRVLWFRMQDSAVAGSAKQTAAEFEALKRSLMGRLVPLARFYLLTEAGMHSVEGIQHPDYLQGGMVDQTGQTLDCDASRYGVSDGAGYDSD